jgi:catechol 2,3-dioxygenase-like lactoylglutathione lyase family enzyme
MNLKGVFEAALFVRDLAKARDFYERALGLETLRESDVGCVFIVAPRQLLLLVSESKARVPSKTPGDEVPPCLVGPGEALGAGHVAFAIDEGDFDAWRTRLESRGVEVLSVVKWEPGGRSLYFRDPDGHLLELATPRVWDARW